MMKTITKILALVLVAALAVCLVACHPKDETAVSLGDIKVTSAMYSYYLIMADMEAQQIVSNSGVDLSAPNFDLYKQKIGEKNYVDYVEELALTKCKEAIAYQKLCKDAGITLDETKLENANYNAYMMWAQGYSSILPLNGVSYETLEKVKQIEAQKLLYFTHLYGKGGDKQIADADIVAAMDENFAGAYLIETTYTDATLKEFKEQFTKYKERLEKGEKFEDIKKEFEASEKKEDTTTSSNSSSSEETSSNVSSNTSSNTSSDVSSESTSSTETSSNTSSETTSSESDEPKAKDELIQIWGSEKTEEYENGYYQIYFPKFADLKAMKLDEVKLIEDTENKKLYLAVKKELKSDPFYRDQLNDILLDILKGDEYDAFLKDYISKLDCKVSSFAIGQFKVKKINYGQ